MQTQRKQAVNEIFMLEKHYDAMYSSFRRQQQLTYTPQELLLVAKAAFLNEQYAVCLEVLAKITPTHSTKVLYQRQSLLFRSYYLLKRASIQQKDLGQLSEILNQVDRLKLKCPGEPFQNWHFEVINNYKKFVLFLDKYRTSSITYNNSDRRTHKRTGFPCYLLSTQWYNDFQQMKRNLQSKVYLGPLTNFALVNDIFESHWYSAQGERYKNVYIFPINKFKVISKKLWTFYTGVFSSDNQFCPIKRLYQEQSYTNDLYSLSAGNQLVQLVPVVVQCQNKIFLSQLTANQLFRKELLPILQQKFGVGQLISKQTVENSFDFFYFNDRSQAILSEWKKSLVYERVRVPQNLMAYQIFKHLDFTPLPPTTMLSKENGLKGLQNLGNSCYMSSCLQCISFTKQIVTFLTSKDLVPEILSKKGRTDGHVTLALSDILKQLWRPSDRSSVIPYKFKKYFGIKNSMFKDKTQEDSHQFLLHLLNSVHQDLRKGNARVNRSESKLQITLDAQDVKNYFIKHELKDNQSIITENMRGIYHTTILCGKCRTSSHSFDSFLALSLPIPYVFYPSFYFYFVGLKAKNTLKYQVIIKNLKSFNEIFFIFQKQIIRKGEIKSTNTPKQFKQQNNFYILLEFQTLKDPVQVWNSKLTNPLTQKDILIEDLMSSRNTFILYQVDKNNYSQLVLVQYKYTVQMMLSQQQKTIGFPKFINLNEKTLHQPPQLLKKPIVQNDIENHFYEQDIKDIKTYKLSISQCSYKYSISVFFKGQESLYKESKYIDKELNSAADEVYSLEDCFKEMNKPQILEGWKCGKCKSSKSAEKTEFIYETNNILIISLKRFQVNGNKIKNMVQYPIKGLNITGWLEDNHSALVQNVYDLYGVCLHSGTMEYGHYKALCKHFVSGQWYQFDDERVRKIEVSDVLSPSAYMLFYRKRQF